MGGKKTPYTMCAEIARSGKEKEKNNRQLISFIPYRHKTLILLQQTIDETNGLKLRGKREVIKNTKEKEKTT